MVCETFVFGYTVGSLFFWIFYLWSILDIWYRVWFEGVVVVCSIDYIARFLFFVWFLVAVVRLGRGYLVVVVRVQSPLKK